MSPGDKSLGREKNDTLGAQANAFIQAHKHDASRKDPGEHGGYKESIEWVKERKEERWGSDGV
jgi:hypothetical protein